VGQEVFQFNVSQNTSVISLPASLAKGIYLGKFVKNGENAVDIIRIVYE
jgi:hypothetical protein